MTESYDKQFLSEMNKVSTTLCLAKWFWVTMHFGMGANHSCYHPLVHKWDLEAVKKNPMALHNTEQKKQERKEMLSSKRPKGCEYCWTVEDLPGNHVSDRMNKSSSFWAKPFLDTVKNATWDSDEIYPTYLEISFSNKCNFMCSYCSPGQSSRWFQEIKKHGSYPVRDLTTQKENLSNQIDEEDNPFIKHFWKWFDDAYKHLKVLRITGGEPLLTKSFFIMLEHVKKNKNEDLVLSVNTNLGVKDETIDELIRQSYNIHNYVKKFKLYTSIDTWGKQAEYIRYGLDTNKFEKNLRRIAEAPNIQIHIMITFGALSIFSFGDLIKKIVEWKKEYGKNKIMFDIAILTNPTQFDVGILPEECSKYFDEVDRIVEENKEIIGVDCESWKKIHAYRNESVKKDHTLNRIDFYRFFNEHDKRRNTDFVKTFPELENFHNYCRELGN